MRDDVNVHDVRACVRERAAADARQSRRALEPTSALLLSGEALALGAIPVLRRTSESAVDARKFADVPVVWIDDWEQLTPHFLEEQWARLRSRAEQRPNAVEARGAHFPFWFHELTARAVAGLHRRRGG